MVTKKVEEVKKDEVKGIVPKQVLDELDRTGFPYLLVVRESDSVIAKNVNGSKIETHTNMVGDAYINSLQSAYRVFMENLQKTQKQVMDAKNKP